MKRISTLILLSLAISSLFFASCTKSLVRVNGNNDVTTVDRPVDQFNRVVNEGTFEVYVMNDSIWKVEIEAESNLISHIITEVKGTTLYVYTRDNLQSHQPMKLYITTPDINEISLSGSGLIYADSLKTNDLEINLSGSGDIRGVVEADNLNTIISGSGWANLGTEISEELYTSISGSGDLEFWGAAQKATFKISGSGTVRAYDLYLKECYADISGSGDMYLRVEDYLNVNISGSGSIYYIGDPNTYVDISGSGSVIKQ